MGCDEVDHLEGALSRLGSSVGRAWSDMLLGVWFRIAWVPSRWSLEWLGFQRDHDLGGLGLGCSFGYEDG